MTRRLFRITSLALAIAAVAAPSASAIDKDGPNAPNPPRSALAIDLVTPDARDAGRPAPAIDRVSPDARDNGRREPSPVVVALRAPVRADEFDWLAAGLGAGVLAAALLLGVGTATTVRTRRGALRAS